MKKGLRTKLDLNFEDHDDFEDLSFEIKPRVKGINKKVQTIKMRKRHGRRDGSTGVTELF